MKEKKYISPLETRYASKDMLENFSAYNRALIWRKLWLSLARNQRKLGVDIPKSAIEDMESNLEKIDFDDISRIEKELRHDVMAHIDSYSNIAKKASGFIHIGATSAYVQDNSDIIMMKDGLKIIISKLVFLIKQLRDFSYNNKSIATMGFTHFQPAQITTVGKRASLWLYDLYSDYKELKSIYNNLEFRGVKGTTGTQASYLAILDKFEKVVELERLIANDFNFENISVVGSQIYSRKQDIKVVNALASFATTIHKITNDIRLLQHMGEIEEPFGKSQIGSSAMPYKKNPMRSERASSLSKFLIAMPTTANLINSTQWLERSLDDSAARRIYIPEAFLTADSLLKIMSDIFSGININKEVIKANIDKYLPFMISEEIIIEAVKNKMNRQEVHEILRKYAVRAKKEYPLNSGVKFLESLKSDKRLELALKNIDKLLNPKRYIGLCDIQVDYLIDNYIDKILEKEDISTNMESLIL